MRTPKPFNPFDMKSARDRGFSLVEMMIAITVLGVGLLSLAGLFPLAMKRVSVGDLESRATFQAQSKLEELKNLRWNQLVASVGNDQVDARFNRTWQVWEDTPAVGMKSVQVVVNWSDENGQRTITLSSLLSDSGI
jgi:prepilin-type N-terminal cleavage/methylation domain-containing protein